MITETTSYPTSPATAQTTPTLTSQTLLLKYIKGRLLKEQEEQLSQLFDMCNTTSKRKMANRLKLEVAEEDYMYTLGYDFPR